MARSDRSSEPADSALERAAQSLFTQYSRQSPRWHGLAWESLREDTRRLFRREAAWMQTRDR
ncbi:hypothetical protein [Azospirillum sp. TSO35-2]|uniref:hypothetical protein n=1 Tax=Azospirillum sp. TSO35-2 TaxID=716796 RepID=UPI000D60B404|nr:hypothetical protein [Azospirillum sp. TSO35-2]PWC31170.1 hypothetical protein TSO352_30620 [Azospirillum sp. TSO35-2]